ncbi:MAG: response regulator, partial [Campylobacterales bacterium]|nr:response regulator [Campylobacterales bacterium]
AHELRTPMNAVIGLSQILLKSELNAKQKEYISKIESSGTILVELVNDILDFSKIEAGKLSVENIVFDINDVLDKVSEILAIKAQEKGIELIFDLEEKVDNVLKGDPLRLGQVIINLMGNAIKFTQSGEVALNIRPLSANMLEFHVRDTGIGLKQEQIDRLFHNFVQASSSTSREYGGSGLGLTISKQLINLMGGEIHVKSEYGKGSEFIFTIATSFEKEKRLYHLPSKDLVGKKVLLIDPNSSTLNALVNMLNYFKYDATLSSDINEAQKLIANETFDIIFIDMKMIRLLDGTLTTISEATKTVVLNSAIELYEQESINGIKIDAYLFKPFTLHKVFELILKIYHQEIVSLTSKENQLSKRDLAQLKGSHIALAEDNKINQTVITAMLEDTDIEVSLFNNGQELLDYLQEKDRTIDLILMDVNMPIMDGYEATRAIAENSQYKQVPIIALTASQAQKDIDKALEVGMMEYLAKPVYMHQLYALLIKYIQPKIEKRMPEVEDLILFSAKFNASIRKFNTLLESQKTDDMEKLIIKMEKEANRVDIDLLDGMSRKMQNIFNQTQEGLNNFLYEYEEASDTFLKAYDTINLDENATQEDIAYAFEVLSLEEGIESFNGDEKSYHKKLSDFCQEYGNSLTFIKQNINDRNKLQSFAKELENKSREIKAKIMIALSKLLNDILNKEQEELSQFIENYKHAFDTTTYV